MSQLNLHEIIRQQQEQLAAMQAQIQALLAAQGGVGAGGTRTEPNTGSHMEMAKPAIFNGEIGKVGGFIMACRLYLKMKMREKKEGGGEAPKQEQRQSLPRPLVWQRRQPLPQQATTVPAPMEGIEQTNAVVVRGAGQGARVPPRRDPFAMEVDQGRNCYACRGFGHMARHCRNRGERGRVADNRRVEYGGGRIEEILNYENNLKEGENLELLN